MKWIKEMFFGKEPKNKRLLELFKELKKLPFPDSDTKSEKLNDMITSLAADDGFLAGYIDQYMHGKDGRKNPREGIKDMLKVLRNTLSGLKKLKCPKEDADKHKAAVNYVKDIIRIGELVLKEKR